MKKLAVLALFVALPAFAQKPLVADIAPDQLDAVGRRVMALRADPTTLTLRVGEKVNLSKIRVTAVDSSGRTIGRLVGFDFAIKPGEPASAYPREVTGVRPGSTDLFVRYPRVNWKGAQPRPEAKLKVVVTP